MGIRKVQTKNGERYVQSFPATPEFWAINPRPPYCSVQKNQQGQWWVSVWGQAESEVQEHLRTLGKRKKLEIEREVCADCGRPGTLVQDQEDGLWKHYNCCDMPS